MSMFENKYFYSTFLAFDILFGCSSILNLTVISIERMMAVKYPATHFNVTRKPILFAIAFVWTFGITFSAISVQFGRSKEYTTVVFVTGFIVPALIILVSYVIIFRVARETVASTSKKIIKEVKVAKMVSIIISLFLLCWLPFFIMNMLYYYCASWCDDIPYSLFVVTKALHYSNSMMNVIVYAVRSPDFRNAFRSLLSHKCKRMKSGSDVALRNLRRRTLTNQESRANGGNDPAPSHNGAKGKSRAGSIPIEKRRSGLAVIDKFRSNSELKGMLTSDVEESKVGDNADTTNV